MNDAKSPYGEWCPTCGKPIIRVTRGIPSMGTCSEGHTTDRRDTSRRPPEVPKTYTEAEVQALLAAAVERAATLADPPLMHRKGRPGLWRTRRVQIADAIRALIEEAKP